MDESVLRGMAKWPNVPAVYGWLTLDRRGHWLIKGEDIANPAVTAFISRNYEHDEQGRWFFQNGPQRVYVAPEYTPIVYRVTGEKSPLEIESHMGKKVGSVSGAWIDETGALLIATEQGIGLVDDRDLERLLSAFIDANGNALPETALDELMQLLQEGRSAPVWLKFGEANVKIEALRSAEAPARFGFDAAPAQPGEA